jgi:hypothetical protein
MKFRLTVTDETGSRTYIATGDRNALMDAAYDDGALGVTVLEAK